MANLKESGFKLWCYFNKNQDNYFMELSQKDCEAWGIKRSSYYRGLEELEEKGFLFIEEDSNKYTFYEMPCENPSDIPNLGKIPKLGTDDARDRALNSQIGNTYSQIETQNSQIGKRYSQIEQRNNTNNTNNTVINNTAGAPAAHPFRERDVEGGETIEEYEHAKAIYALDLRQNGL